jgi:antitoxin MazE
MQYGKGISKEAMMRIGRRGSSLAIRIPARVVRALGLKAGDRVAVRVVDFGSTMAIRDTDKPMLLEKLRTFRGRLPIDFRFDREEANTR